MTIRLKPLPASICELVDRHHAAQSRPHPHPHVVRPRPRGELVALALLRLDECLPRNRSRREQPWQAKAARDTVLARLQSQLRPQLHPLRGRPQVVCYRYSSKQPDAHAGWGKTAVDCLQPSGERTYSHKIKSKHPIKDGEYKTIKRKRAFVGLNIIASDEPSKCEVIETWEPATNGHGFVIIEIWDGEWQ